MTPVLRVSRVLLAAVVAISFAGTAKPDTIHVFDATAIFSGGGLFFTQFALTGTITVDVTAGTITAADVIASGPVLSNSQWVPYTETFTQILNQDSVGSTYYHEFQLSDPGTGNIGYFTVATSSPTGSLIGFEGGQFVYALGFVTEITSPAGFLKGSGGLSPAVPEPKTSALAVIGLIVAGAFSVLWRDKQHARH